MTGQQTLFDFRKVIYCKFYWITSDGCYVRKNRPIDKTIHGQEFYGDQFATPYHIDYPCELIKERAHRLGWIDTWIPVLEVHLQSIRMLTFRGDKAQKLWAIWNAKIYGNKFTQHRSEL